MPRVERNGKRKTRDQMAKRRVPELGYYFIVTDTKETEQNYMLGLENQQKVDIYQLSDGEHSTRDIASQVTPKCGHNTVARCWKRWALQGLVVPAERKGRFKAAFNLEEYGITEVKEEE